MINRSTDRPSHGADDDGTWSYRAEVLDVPPNEVHLWRACLDIVPSALCKVGAALASDEITRASRFVFPRDRNRFIAGRGILREILAKYLRRAAAEIEFIYEPQGKPRVRLQDSDPPIRFNVSHSDSLAVYAISLDRELGVDVEAIRHDIDAARIAEQFFSPREITALRSLPLDKQHEAFFLCWTRKEAYIKAVGAGLAIPLDSFDVSLSPSDPVELHSGDSTRWILRSFRPLSVYAGALVVEGERLELKLWDYMAFCR